MSDENTLINPEDLKREPRTEKEIDSKEKVKFRTKGNLVEVNFESDGRFSLPDTIFFEDYNVSDIQELAVSDLDNILETLVVILNRLKNKDCEASIGKSTPNEFLEILLGMKVKFDSPEYKHIWMCKCQSSLHEDEQKVNEDIISLGSIKFRSIQEIDEKFKKQFKEIFDKMTDDQFKKYLKDKYRNSDMNIELLDRIQETNSIKIKEPIVYQSVKDGKKYKFNFMRVEDVIEAQQMVNVKYRPLLKSIQNRKNNNIPIDVFKAEKEEELTKIDRSKAKDIMTYSEGLTLIGTDDNEIKNKDEKINAYSKLKRSDYFDLENFLKDINYGIYSDIKLRCPHCGESEGRLLQQDINPIELLPIDTNTKDRSIKGDNGGINIYFGI